MAFEKPTILFCLFLLLIPILIHLFNLKKYKKIYFPNIDLLQKIKTEKRRISKIKNLLILISRLILMATLIIAFSKPYIPGKGYLKTPIEKISIYIDNSLSMSIKNKNTLLEEAKRKSTQIINNLNDNTKINIITNDFEFKNERFLNKENSLDLIENIKLSPFGLNICEVIKRQNRIIKHDSLVSKFIISDFQENFIQESNNCSENLLEHNLIKINAQKTNNLSLNSCYFKSPFRKLNKEEELIIEIQNHSNENRKNVLLDLFINNKKRGFLNIDIDSQSVVKKTIPFTNLEPGNIHAKVQIENDEFEYDNTLFFSYQIKEKINILSISENDINPSIKTVFNDAVFNLDVFRKNQINFEKIENYDLIILDNLSSVQKGLTGFLKESLIKGKNVFLFPNKNIDLESYNFLLKELKGDQMLNWKKKQKDVKKINYDHLLFENVFTKEVKDIELPNTRGYYKLKTNNLNQRNYILNFLNNDPFIIEYNNYKGNLYICTSPLDLNITNFTKHAIFLPIMYNVAFNIYSSKLYETIDQNLKIKCPACKPQSTLYLRKDNEFEIALENEIINNINFLNIGTNIKENGNYNLYSSKNLEKYISFNFNRNEGKLNNNDFKTEKNIFSNSLDEMDNKTSNKEKKRKNLIFYFIILGIISFLFETLLLKFWKN